MPNQNVLDNPASLAARSRRSGQIRPPESEDRCWSRTIPRAILERTGHEQTIGDVVADGQSRWSADSAGGLVPSPDYSGALYDAEAGSSTYPHGAPGHALSNGGGTGNHAAASPSGPASGNGTTTAGNSPWWTDARSDPWRGSQCAGRRVILSAPQPDPVHAAEVDGPRRRVSLGQVLLISLLAALLPWPVGSGVRSAIWRPSRVACATPYRWAMVRRRRPDSRSERPAHWPPLRSRSCRASLPSGWIARSALPSAPASSCHRTVT